MIDPLRGETVLRALQFEVDREVKRLAKYEHHAALVETQKRYVESLKQRAEDISWEIQQIYGTEEQ